MVVSTKFSVKHQGKDIHHPPSINDLWMTFLGPPLALPFPWASHKGLERKVILIYGEKSIMNHSQSWKSQVSFFKCSSFLKQSSLDDLNCICFLTLSDLFCQLLIGLENLKNIFYSLTNCILGHWSFIAADSSICPNVVCFLFVWQSVYQVEKLFAFTA